jgi:glycosyltransferase involved in cell wall biosynthesis
MKMSLTKLAQANLEFRKKNFEAAEQLYFEIVASFPDLDSFVSFNIALAKKRRGVRSSHSEAVPLVQRLHEGEVSPKPSVGWIIGKNNEGWAYGNNAKRLSSRLTDMTHLIGETVSGDCNVYFDILIHATSPKFLGAKILRIGGPRPLRRLVGDNLSKLKEELCDFHAVICLNRALAGLAARFHPNVVMIPNGLELLPSARVERFVRPVDDFVVGFAGSVQSDAERKTKGLELVTAACNLARVPLISVGRGPGQRQVAHHSMVEEFYRKIDVLVHPVDEGREGCSNVIMEALANGIPVITTRYAGYHAECSQTDPIVIYCKRDARHIAGRINELRKNSTLRSQMGIRAIEFARDHHNIERISKRYADLIKSAIRYQTSAIKIAFVPFWLPVSDYASARIRCRYPINYLNDLSGVAARLGYDRSAHVIVISQLADDITLNQIETNPGQLVVYDVCDRYHASDAQVGNAAAKDVFFRIVKRADLILVPTVGLKKEITELGVRKPVFIIPDGFDYQEFERDSVVRPNKGVVGWFGNAGRGNLDSVLWMLKVAENEGFSIKLIGRRRSIRSIAPSLENSVVDWKYDTFVEALRALDLVVLSHSPEEAAKSPNRLITSVRQGVPAIVHSSPVYERLLKSAGLDWAIATDEAQLRKALNILKHSQAKERYLNAMSKVIGPVFSPTALREKYKDILVDIAQPKFLRNFKVLFVSHNLNIGEGAPFSLFQTIIGLKRHHQIQPAVYSPVLGELKKEYEKEGVDIHYSSTISTRDCLKILHSNFSKAREAFKSVLSSGKFDLVVCNTAKMLPYAAFAIELDLPTVVIVRESSDEHLGLNFSKNNNVLEASKLALEKASCITFVAENTRSLWVERHGLPRTCVIHNGLDAGQWGVVKSRPKCAVRTELGLPEDSVIVLSVGTISARKAQLDLVRAFSRVVQSCDRNVRLALVGARPGPYLTYFYEQISQLPTRVRDAIIIVAETPAVANWYRASDIFVLSSHNESYPRVILEALYFELNVIATSIFGVREQITDAASGALYEPGDIDELTRLLSRAIQVEGGTDTVAPGIDAYHRLDGYYEMLARYKGLIASVA